MRNHQKKEQRSKTPQPDARQSEDSTPYSWSAEVVIKTVAAAVAASGASYLLGYLAQINFQYFFFVGPGDYVNAALIYLPVTVCLLIASSLPAMFRAKRTQVRGLFEGRWKNKKGAWSDWFQSLLKWTTMLLFISMGLMLMSTLRFGGTLNPMTGILSAILLLAFVRECYAYSHHRYGFTIANWSTLVGATYYLVTAFFVGYLHSWTQEQMPHYDLAVQTASGEHFCISTIRKVGSKTLFYDLDHNVWVLIEANELGKVVDLGAQYSAYNHSCESIITALPQFARAGTAGIIEPIVEPD